jgi:chloramphenicol 3-O-phosphotransferase
MILLLNGAFGIGKTTVARALVARLRRSILFNPELIGIPMQRIVRVTGRSVDDFQDLASWRRWTISVLRMTRRFRENVVVPMAFSNVQYLDEIRAGIRAFEPHVLHFCLVAPLDVVQERLQRRRNDATEWELRRAGECCIAHRDDAFAQQIDAAHRNPDEIADEILRSATP